MSRSFDHALSSTDQPQSTSPSKSQANIQSKSQSINQSTSPINQPLNQSINPIHQSNGQSNPAFFNKQKQQEFDELKAQTMPEMTVNQSPNHFFEDSLTRINNMRNQSINQSINQSNIVELNSNHTNQHAYQNGQDSSHSSHSNQLSHNLSPTESTNQSINHLPPFLRRVSPLDRRDSGVRLRSSIHEQLINPARNHSTTTNQYVLRPLRRTASGTKLSHKNFALLVNTRSVEDFRAYRNQSDDQSTNQSNNQSNNRRDERFCYQLDDGTASKDTSSNDQSSDSESGQTVNNKRSLSINVLQPSPIAQRGRQSNNQSSNRSNNASSPSSTSPLESPRALNLSLPRSNSISFHELGPLPESPLPLQIDSSSNQSSLHHSPTATPNAILDALEIPLPLTAELIKSPEGELLKEQLDGTLKKRGDSYLNIQSLDLNDGLPDQSINQPVQLAVPIPMQLRSQSGVHRRVYFRTDGTNGLDIIELIKEERPAADEVIDEATWKPRLPIKNLFPRPSPAHGVLRTVNIRGTEEEHRRRERRAAVREREWVAVMQAGALFTKYSWQDGKPQQRWFWVSEDTQDLCWEKPNNQWKKSPPVKMYDSDSEDLPVAPISARLGSYVMRSPRVPVVAPLQSANSAPSIHDSRSKRRASLPSAMRIFSLKFQNDRKRSLLDISGVHYGPYRSTRFQRYLTRKDNALGYGWLCMTIVFQDRTLDLVACDETQVTSWFMGMQCLAPLSVHNLSIGGLLWRRLIMKLNHFGLAPVRLEKISQWCEHG